MKTLKFRCFLIVACINSVILLAVRSPAVAQLIVSLPDTVVSPGDTLLLPVKVKLPQDGENIYSLQFEITYQSDFVSVDTVFVDTTSVLWTLDWKYEVNITEGRTVVAFAGADSLSEDGTIALIAFRISDTASGGDSSLLYFDVLWANEGVPEAVPSHGSVNVLTVGVNDRIWQGITPDHIELRQNYPNPFNAETTIKYTLPVSDETLLTIYNLQGKEISRLVERRQSAGVHSAAWNASNVSSGIYFYRLQAGDKVLTRKMVLLR